MLISNEIFYSYLVCEQKAFFKLSGQIGVKSTYESLYEKLMQMLISKYQRNLETHNNIVIMSKKDEFVINELDLTCDFLFDVNISSSKYTGNIHALKIVRKNSRH